MSTEPTDAAAPPPKRKRRWWRWLLGLLLLALAVPLGWVGWIVKTRADEREAVYAELDRTDPGWRIEAIEMRRRVVRDEDNAALRVLAVQAKLQQGKFAHGFQYERFNHLLPEVQLHGSLQFPLQQVLDPFAALREEAILLKDRPAGRYSITYSTSGFDTRLESYQLLGVLQFLTMDFWRRTQDQDSVGASESLCAILNATRSVGDEPFALSQFSRSCRSQDALDLLERLLAQGTPPEISLRPLQTLLEIEMDEPERLPPSLRGERAIFHRFYTALRNGSATLDAPRMGRDEKKFEWKTRYLLLTGRDEVETLRQLTEQIEASKKPFAEREQAFLNTEIAPRDLTGIGRTLQPTYRKIASRMMQYQAALRCACVAVAAERYRLRTKQWPASLEVLVKERLLRALPTDPYDGQPLRGKSRAQGYVVYSVGPDLLDNKGTIDRDNPLSLNTDLGFRLWDVPNRRQPAVMPEQEPDKPPEEPMEPAEPAEPA